MVLFCNMNEVWKITYGRTGGNDVQARGVCDGEMNQGDWQAPY